MLANTEALLHKITGVQTLQMMTDLYGVAAKALRAAHAGPHGVSLDSVHDVLDDLAEAMQEHEDVGAAIGEHLW